MSDLYRNQFVALGLRTASGDGACNIMDIQSQLSQIQQPADEYHSRASVLIAEDEPLLAEYMASVARSHGFEAIIAATAMEFEEGVKTRPPHAIITDLAMPDKDGVELMRFLAELGYGGPVLVISACDHRVIETSVSLGREMGLHVFGSAQKPVTDDQLREMLVQSLHGVCCNA